MFLLPQSNKILKLKKGSRKGGLGVVGEVQRALRERKLSWDYAWIERKKILSSTVRRVTGIRSISPAGFWLFFPTKTWPLLCLCPVSLCLPLLWTGSQKVTLTLEGSLVLNRSLSDMEEKCFALPFPEVTLFLCSCYSQLSWKVWNSLPAFCHNLLASEICREFQD